MSKAKCDCGKQCQIENRLKKWGILAAEAKQLSEEFEHDYVSSKLDIVEWVLSDIKATRAERYLRMLIREDYVPAGHPGATIRKS